MKQLLFATAAYNLAETTRMLEISKACRGKFESSFLIFGGQFKHLIDDAGFPIHRLEPYLTPWRIIVNEIPCTAQSTAACRGCTLTGRLMCRYETRDTAHFFMIALPFFVTSIAGIIRSGHGGWLLGWLAYALFFFFVWEGRVLCSHCPYWAEEGRVLHCHANYGVIKLWKYHPGPMSRSEQAQFLIGALLLIVYPLAFLIVGQEYLLAVIGLTSATSATYLLRRNICTRCINFSCPLNGVDAATRMAFFARNPVIAQAWNGVQK